jgi:hypothetical protein
VSIGVVVFTPSHDACAFLAQLHPQLPVLHVDIINPHRKCDTDPRERKRHQRDRAASPACSRRCRRAVAAPRPCRARWSCPCARCDWVRAPTRPDCAERSDPRRIELPQLGLLPGLKEASSSGPRQRRTQGSRDGHGADKYPDSNILNIPIAQHF